MRFIRSFALLSLFLLSATPAGAITVNDFCAAGADPCEFKGSPLNVDANTSLDFGSRTLIIGNAREINVTGGVQLTLKAGTVIMRQASQIHNAATATGASIAITADDDIILEKAALGSPAKIEVPGTQVGGSIQFTAGRNIVVDGELRANGTLAEAEGGLMDMDAGGSITLSGTLNLTGGSIGSGGEIIVGANGPVVVNGPISAFGGFDGGTIDLSSNESLSTAATLDVRGTAGGSLAGNIIMTVVGSITIGGKIVATGAGSLTEGGGSGGDIDMNAGASIGLNEVVDASGGTPEGFGGIVSFIADVDILQNRSVFAVGSGPGGIGGDVSYSAGRRLSFAAPNDVSGSNQGGDFAANARGTLEAKNDIIVSGEGVDGSGGTIQLDGLVLGVPQVSGNIVISGALRARGDGATVSGGGSIGVQGCDVTIQPTGVLNNFGDKSSNDIRAGGLLTIAAGGQVLARPAGTNLIKFRDQTKPPVIAGLIDPLATPVRDGTLAGCQPPPPTVCGDGEPTGVEGCDDGNLTSCDGCSGGSNGMTCHNSGCCQEEGCGNGMQECGEQCDDGNVVDGDGCDSNCTPTACGNGRVTGNEECDDDNTTNGDGCNSSCQIESPPGCGNGMIDAGEDCDDNNTVSCDGCSKLCRTERCGNNVTECAEKCDDGGSDACDGNCAADCSRPANVCNDGFTDTACGEQCDPMDPATQAGCSGFCQTCAIGSGTDCPCTSDFDCAPTGRCAGFACLNGTCSNVTAKTCNDGNDCNGVEACVPTDTDAQCTVGSSPTCNDDDPCTDDACNPVGGCPHPRKTGFPGITCRIEFITTAADAAGVADLPTKTRAKILKLAGGASTRLGDAATETKVKRQRKLLKGAEGQLAKLGKLLAKSIKKNQINATLGTRLKEQADGALSAARTLRAGLTG